MGKRLRQNIAFSGLRGDDLLARDSRLFPRGGIRVIGTFCRLRIGVSAFTRVSPAIRTDITELTVTTHFHLILGNPAHLYQSRIIHRASHTGLADVTQRILHRRTVSYLTVGRDADLSVQTGVELQ